VTEPSPAGHSSIGRRLARNTVFSAVGEGSNLLLFLLGFVATRYLAPSAFGVYSAAFAFVGLFRILPDFGMSYASTLAISRDRSRAAGLAGNLLGFQLVLSILTLALCLGLGRLRYDGVLWTAVLVLSFDLVLKSLKSTLRWLLKSHQHFGTEAASLLLERSLLLGLGTASLAAGGGVVGFVLVFAGVRALDTTGLLLWVHRRVLALRPSFDLAVWGELFRKGLPFAYAGAMITMFFQVDALMLEQMRGVEEVGWYRAPVLVLEGLTLVPRIFGYALIPTMAALYPTAPESVTALCRRGMKYLLLIGLPMAAFGLIAARPFVTFLFGAKYGPSVDAARILIPAVPFMFLSNFGETTLACIDRWRTIVIVSTVCLLLNVGLNLVWIPGLGYRGAARATLVTEIAYFAATAVSLRLFGHRLSWLSLAARPVLATAVFAGVLWASRGLGLLASSLLAGVAFAGATFLLRVWDPKERDLVRSLLQGAAADPTDLV
jgi:O-antigen/teichoic acid export membrane protein